MAEHKVGYVAIIVITLVAMLVMFMMNALNNGFVPGLYQHSDMSELSDKYYIEITPTGATFSIWGAIYLWQVLFIAYGLSTICRKGPDGSYLYCSMKIMPISIYISYMINCALNASWLIIFDREIMPAALTVIILMWLTLVIPLVISHKAVHDHLETMQKLNLIREVWLVRFLVQNAHAFYCTWLTVATLLNLTIVLSYDAGVDMPLASTVALGILSAEILLWLVLDFIVLRHYTQYLFSQYIVLPIALSGSLAKNFDIENHNTIITIALLVVAVLAAFIKLFLMICSYRRRNVGKTIESTEEKPPIPA